MAARRRKAKFFDDIGLKLLSLALALLLELYFYSPDNSVVATIPAMIRVRNIPPGTMIVDPVHAEKGIPAEVRVRGPRPLVTQARAVERTLWIDFPLVGQSVYSGVVELDQVRVPAGVEVLGVEPGKVTITVEKVVAKVLPIVVDHAGKIANGYRLQELSVFPSTVVVRGPKGMVEPLRAVETHEFDLSQVKEPLRTEVSLKEPGPTVSLGLTDVTLELKIVLEKINKSFSDVKVVVRAAEGAAAKVEPSEIEIEVRGGVLLMKDFTGEGLEAVVDTKGLAEGTHLLAPVVNLPQGINLIKTQPEKVEVLVWGGSGGVGGGG